jgi:hypothetical protein
MNACVCCGQLWDIHLACGEHSVRSVFSLLTSDVFSLLRRVFSLLRTVFSLLRMLKRV